MNAKNFLERFKEPSTWAALAVLVAGTPIAGTLSAIGEIAPQLIAGVFALAGVFMKEQSK